MNDIAIPQRRRRHGLPAAAAVAMAVLAAACSGSGSSAGASPGAGGSANSPSAVAYSACMRSQGVPNYPDPDSSGQLPKTSAQLLGVGTSQYDAAQQACRHLLPTTGSFQQQTQQCLLAPGACPPAVVQQILTAERRFAQSMRSHGLPKFPDPTIDSQGRPVFAWSISKDGMDPHSSQFRSKEGECQRLTGGAPEPREVSP